MKSGVYELVNTTNRKRYIGSAVSLVRRWHGHRVLLRAGAHPNRHLQSAWRLVGESAFTFRKLLVCKPEHLLMYEQLCLDGLTPEYNICPIAGSQLGAKRTSIFCRRNGDLKRGRQLSAEHRERIRIASTGRVKSEQERAKLSASLVGRVPGFLGRKHTDETKARMRLAANGNRANYGRRFTAEHRARISTSLRRYYGTV